MRVERLQAFCNMLHSKRGMPSRNFNFNGDGKDMTTREERIRAILAAQDNETVNEETSTHNEESWIRPPISTLPRYSEYFKTIYDERIPSSTHGRGTHYSILQAPMVSQTDPTHYNFAVIWDEDHDERVIGRIEMIYLHGMLKYFLMFGERKGFFSAIHTDAYNISPSLEKNIEWIGENSEFGSWGNDAWGTDVSYMQHTGIINAPASDIYPYLKKIMIDWELGTAIIPLVDYLENRNSKTPRVPNIIVDVGVGHKK